MITEYLAKACRSVAAAQGLLEDGAVDDATSRAYYAAFNTMRALILHRDPAFGSKTHGPTLSEFSRRFVKTGELPSEWGRLVNRAQTARHVADYGEEDIGADEARGHVKVAQDLIAFARSVIPEPLFPRLPEKSGRTLLMEEREQEAVKRSLAQLLCKLLVNKKETLPKDLEAELALYGTEGDLGDLILDIDAMQDLKSFVGEKIAAPSLG